VAGELGPAEAARGRVVAPLVGREPELEVLRSVLDRVEAKRAPHLVTVTGDPGVGKSRLLEEFAASLEEGTKLLVGRCLSYGEGVTLRPLGEILAAEAGVLENDAPEAALAKITLLVDAVAAGVTVDPDRTAAALASKLLLGYVEDSVGAWTDPDVLALPGATRAGDALERVRHAEATVRRVFVTTGEGRLEGWVPLPALLRAPADATLGSILQRPESVISARTPLAGALAHPGWEHASLLPVVEPGERLVGVLTRDALTRALGRTARAQRAAPAGTLGGMLALGYWDALSGGAEAMVTLLPGVRAVGRSPDER